MKKDIVVKKSKIHGKGVFACRDFKKGEVVLIWKPKFINKKEASLLTESNKPYLFHTNKKIILMQPPERYVNHSGTPNTFVKGYSDVALEDILVGTEITSNYGKENIDFKIQ